VGHKGEGGGIINTRGVAGLLNMTPTGRAGSQAPGARRESLDDHDSTGMPTPGTDHPSNYAKVTDLGALSLWWLASVVIHRPHAIRLVARQVQAHDREPQSTRHEWRRHNRRRPIDEWQDLTTV
jgi:hypothetical protein